MNTDYLSYFNNLFLEQIRGIYFSDLIILLLMGALICFVPGYVLHIKKSIKTSRIVIIYLMVVYFGVILLLTILRRDAGSKSGEIYTDLNLGFTRAGVYSVRQFMYSLMNVALFVPWGILLGLYRIGQPLIRIVFMTTITGFITSIAIEITQNITRTGNFEVTDLFTNVVGTFIGAICVTMCVIILRRMKKNEAD